MLITDEIFSRSCYYIGAGYDAQPLWRFTHLCDTFLFANLFLSSEQVRKWFEWEITRYHDAELLAVVEIANFGEEAYLPAESRARQRHLNTSFMTPAEQRDYAAAFTPALQEAKWGLEFRIYRPSLNRTITLFYFTAEGLATYVGLSDNGRLAPRVLCTVDTKVLEHSDGMLNRFFAQQTAQAPLLWVRGFSPTYDSGRIDNNALNESGALSVAVMTPMHRWRVGRSYRKQLSDKRYCRAFTTAATAIALAAAPVRPHVMPTGHTLAFQRLDVASLLEAPTEAVVIPRRLRAMLGLPDTQVICWEDAGAHTWWDHPTQSAAGQVAALEAYLVTHRPTGLARLHLIPFCLEDEGATYVQALAALPCPTCTYLAEAADFLDLRLLAE